MAPDGLPERTTLSRRRLLKSGIATLGAASLSSSLASRAAAGSLERLAADAAKRGGTIKIGLGTSASTDSLDPALSTQTFAFLAAGLHHDALVRLDEQWKTTPMLAESWTMSKDARVYTFRLRDGVEFHSGKTLDANDVVWSMSRILDPKLGSPGLSTFQPVLSAQGMKAIDKRTVQFRLKQPDVFFLVKLGFWYGRISQADWDFTQGSGGTGPFKSKSFQGGQGFESVRNANYWQSGLPLLDGVNCVVISEPSTKAAAVLSGDVDLIDPPPFSMVPQFQKSSKIAILKSPLGDGQEFGIGLNHKPYQDARVRKALNMLLDRQKFVDIVARGQAIPTANSVINPNDPYYPHDVKPPPYDPEQAKSLLKQAGYSNGWNEVVYSSRALLGLDESAALLKQFWAVGKINLSIQSLPIDQWVKHLNQAGVWATYWHRQHPSTILPNMYASGGPWNEAHLKDPVIDKLLRQVTATPSFARQKEMYGEIIRRYVSESSSIWPVAYSIYWPHKTRLSGVALSPTDIADFRRAQVV